MGWEGGWGEFRWEEEEGGGHGGLGSVTSSALTEALSVRACVSPGGSVCGQGGVGVGKVGEKEGTWGSVR